MSDPELASVAAKTIYNLALHRSTRASVKCGDDAPSASESKYEGDEDEKEDDGGCSFEPVMHDRLVGTLEEFVEMFDDEEEETEFIQVARALLDVLGGGASACDDSDMVPLDDPTEGGLEGDGAVFGIEADRDSYRGQRK